MDHLKQAPKKGSMIWRKLTGLTHWLYHAVGNSPLGKGMTAYRKADALLHHDRRRTHRDDCRPMSPARLRLMEAVGEGKLFKLISGLFSGLARTSASVYGFFLLIYGLLNALLYFVGPMIRPELSYSFMYLFMSGGTVLLSIPMLCSNKPIVQLLVTGRLTAWFFVRLLGLPAERLVRPRPSEEGQSRKAWSAYVALLLALGCGAAALWISPLVIPLCFILLCLVGMIFAFPETGVILAISSVPLVFFSNRVVWIPAAVIVLTWIAFGIKLLFMHRAIRFNLMDVAVLIFSATLALAGMTGGYVTATGVWTGILCFVIFSLYFLITNLMTSRVFLRRCLVGPCLSLALIIGVYAMEAIPGGWLDWLLGSKGGNALQGGFETIRKFFVAQAQPFCLCMPLMAIPFLFSLLRQKRRPLYYVFLSALILLCFFVLYLAGSVGAVIIAAGCVVLYFLFLSHRCLAAGILAVPAAVAGGIWLDAAYASDLGALATRLAEGQEQRSMIWRGVWRAVCDHPAGIGLGDSAFSAVYPQYAEAGAAAVTEASGMYMELLLRTGFPGLILFLVMVFLFLQKTFTCLMLSENARDSSKLLGGMFALVSLLLYGLVSNAPLHLPVLFVAVVVLGVCNAYENTIFDLWDVSQARMSREEHRADCVFHAPGM